MNYEQMSNNKVYLRGKVISEPVFSHEVYNEGFYEVQLSVNRLSESADIIPITISERILSDNNIKIDSEITIQGQFRSYNKQIDGKSRLVLTVFAREIVENNEDINPNIIELNGFVCKTPVFRTTPFKREICDVLIAVNRAYNKSDYLPCIAWGRNARFVKNLDVGEKVNVVGRIQSRNYQKRVSDDVVENKVAYEISITKIATGNDLEDFYIIPSISKANYINS